MEQQREAAGPGVIPGNGSDAIKPGPFAPLRVRDFRRIWSSSLLSNLGHMILGVAAAWEMTRLTGSPAMIAMVQTALMLPLMLVALPAGALADMFDRRAVALCGLALASGFGVAMAVVGYHGLITPSFLLLFLFLIGSGVALYGPAWQASIGELVPAPNLPAAVALGSVSYNLARSFGPAIGGIIVLAAGTKLAFAVNAACYVPLILAIFVWKRVKIASRLPPESFGRALISGFRYVRHAPRVRNAVGRSFLFGLAGASTGALAPLIARDLLGGDAATYGLLLCASGVGAIAGSLGTSHVRERLGPENAVRAATLTCAAATAGVALSRSIPLTAILYAVQGATTLLCISMLNVGVQLAAPRWVMARALSLFASAMTGGFAIGSLGVGLLAGGIGVEGAVLAAALGMAITVLVGFLLPVTRELLEERTHVSLGDEPDVKLAVTARSGPIVVEIDYRVAVDDARDFYRAMQEVGVARRRNGGFDWSLARDVSDPELWTERFHCPTWGDYLHMRSRFTQADLGAQARAEAFNILGLADGGRVRRRLERPFGSVRWREDAPDPRQPDAGIVAP